MNHRAERLLVTGLALALLGCQRELRDTENHVLEIECEKSPCTLVERSKDGPDVPFEVVGDGRLALACPSGHSAFDCRPLVCEQSAPCAQVAGPDFSCENGLCQAPSRSITSADRQALCLAGQGEWKRTRDQVRLMTLSRGCMGDCIVPAACRKP